MVPDLRQDNLFMYNFKLPIDLWLDVCYSTQGCNNHAEDSRYILDV